MSSSDKKNDLEAFRAAMREQTDKMVKDLPPGLLQRGRGTKNRKQPREVTLSATPDVDGSVLRNPFTNPVREKDAQMGSSSETKPKKEESEPVQVSGGAGSGETPASPEPVAKNVGSPDEAAQPSVERVSPQRSEEQKDVPIGTASVEPTLDVDRAIAQIGDEKQEPAVSIPNEDVKPSEPVADEVRKGSDPELEEKIKARAAEIAEVYRAYGRSEKAIQEATTREAVLADLEGGDPTESMGEKDDDLLVEDNFGTFPGQEKPALYTKEGLTKEAWAEEIARLHEEVNTARAAYFEVQEIDADEKSLWERVVRQFKGVKRVADPEYLKRRERYDVSLKSLESAELQRIKESGLKGEKMNETLAGVLRVFQVDERLRFYEMKVAADLAERETSLPGRLLSRAEKLVGWYQKQPTKTKYLIAAGFFGGALAAGAVGGVFASGAIVGARRVLSMASLGTGANALLEKKQKERRKKKLESDFEMEKQVLTQKEDADEALEAFHQKFGEFFRGLNREVAEWQGDDQKRKALAATIGVGGGLALSEGMAWGMEHGGSDFLRACLDKLGIHLTGSGGVRLGAASAGKSTPEVFMTSHDISKDVPGASGTGSGETVAQPKAPLSPAEQIQRDLEAYEKEAQGASMSEGLPKNAPAAPERGLGTSPTASESGTNQAPHDKTLPDLVGETRTQAPTPAPEKPIAETPGIPEKAGLVESILRHNVVKGETLWGNSLKLAESLGIDPEDQKAFAALVEEKVREAIEGDPSLTEKLGFSVARFEGSEGADLWLIEGKPVDLTSILTSETLQDLKGEFVEDLSSAEAPTHAEAKPSLAAWGDTVEGRILDVHDAPQSATAKLDQPAELAALRARLEAAEPPLSAQPAAPSPSGALVPPETPEAPKTPASVPKASLPETPEVSFKENVVAYTGLGAAAAGVGKVGYEIWKGGRAPKGEKDDTGIATQRGLDKGTVKYLQFLKGLSRKEQHDFFHAYNETTEKLLHAPKVTESRAKTRKKIEQTLFSRKSQLKSETKLLVKGTHTKDLTSEEKAAAKELAKGFGRTQRTRLQKFYESVTAPAPKGFGHYGEPQPGEDLHHYIFRMVAWSRETGRPLPDFEKKKEKK